MKYYNETKKLQTTVYLLLVSLQFQILLSNFVNKVLSHFVLYSLQFLQVFRPLLFVCLLQTEHRWGLHTHYLFLVVIFSSITDCDSLEHRYINYQSQQELRPLSLCQATAEFPVSIIMPSLFVIKIREIRNHNTQPVTTRNFG